MEATDRGFGVFAKRERPQEEWLYGRPATVVVLESSLAFRGAHVRIYEGDDAVQLNVVEARVVIEGLTEFVRAAEAGELTEPAVAELTATEFTTLALEATGERPGPKFGA